LTPAGSNDRKPNQLRWLFCSQFGNNNQRDKAANLLVAQIDNRLADGVYLFEQVIKRGVDVAQQFIGDGDIGFNNGFQLINRGLGLVDLGQQVDQADLVGGDFRNLQ